MQDTDLKYMYERKNSLLKNSSIVFKSLKINYLFFFREFEWVKSHGAKKDFAIKHLPL